MTIKEHIINKSTVGGKVFLNMPHKNSKCHAIIMCYLLKMKLPPIFLERDLNKKSIKLVYAGLTVNKLLEIVINSLYYAKPNFEFIKILM